MKIGNELRGTGQVFRFTFLQLLKSKGNIIGLILTLLLSMGSIPLVALMTGSAAPSEPKSPEVLYFDDRTGLAPEDLQSELRKNDHFAELTVKTGALPEADGAGVGMTLEEGAEAFELTVRWNEELEADGERISELASLTYDIVRTALLRKAGLGEDAVRLLTRRIETRSETAEWIPLPDGFDPEPDEGGFDEGAYGTQLGYSIILMMFCVFSVSFIIRSVIEQKASKLVDLLLVSLKPAALLFGKVLAVLVYVMIYMALLFGGMILSLTVTSQFLDVSSAEGVIGALRNLHPDAGSLAVILITSLLGYLGFGLLSGLSGAGCSTLDDSSGAMSTCMLLIMGGYIVSLFGSMGSGSFTRALCVIPCVSVFTAPVCYMNGKIGFGTVALSWVLQAVCILALIWLAGKVYSRLIIYNGTRLKLSDILKMAKEKEAAQ